LDFDLIFQRQNQIILFPEKANFFFCIEEHNYYEGHNITVIIIVQHTSKNKYAQNSVFKIVQEQLTQQYKNIKGQLHFF
jgi:hypothetical protein